MGVIIQYLDESLKNINIMIEKKEFDDAYQEYIRLHECINSEKDETSYKEELTRVAVADFYASYAYFLFSFSEYEQFFEMYVLAQNYGYSGEKRRTFIYEAFVQPNLEEYLSNYTRNIENMIEKGCIKESLDFSELPFWLITSGNENEYYLFDKETNLIKEKFIWYLSEFAPSKDIVLDTNSDEQLIIGCAVWLEFQDYLKNPSYCSKKKYFVNASIKKLFSYLQGGTINDSILNQLIFLKNEKELKEYFLYCRDYLPRKIWGTNEEKIIYAKIIEEIHLTRLKKDNRSGDNVLLSIGIPSFNRGKRAYDNVIHTLSSNYDEEIEVVVSNNGTQNETKDFYQKISLIDDARINYFEFEKNQGVALNICKVLELAKGKYVLMTSDEDLIDLSNLKIILNLLRMIEDRNIALIRTRTDGQGIVPYFGVSEPGLDSLRKFMLTSNYMTGMIFKKEMIEKYELLNYIRTNLENEVFFYYPHVVMELVLCQYSSILGLDIISVNEGKPEKTEVEYEKIGEEVKKVIPYYATFEGRINQHKGFFEVIKELEISKNDFDIFRELYLGLCRKTIYLVSLSINVYYKDTDEDVLEIMNSAYNEVIKYFDNLYYGKKGSNKYKYKEDIKKISEYYRNVKNRMVKMKGDL